MSIIIRPVETLADATHCRDLAAQVWGAASACSVAQMTVHAKYGGVVLLALDEEQPIGFLFSFPALYRGEWVLWSHETAVLPGYLHQGIGTDLKRTQQKRAADLGYQRIAWTFDPLVSRNAFFNLRKLGASISEYKVNAYGTDDSDAINQGLETDRFIAVWGTHDVPPGNGVEPREGLRRLAIGGDGQPLLPSLLPLQSQPAQLVPSLLPLQSQPAQLVPSLLPLQSQPAQLVLPPMPPLQSQPAQPLLPLVLPSSLPLPAQSPSQQPLLANERMGAESASPARTKEAVLYEAVLKPAVLSEAPRAETEVFVTEVPLNFETLLAEDKDTAARWRLAFRQVALELMKEGYRPTGFAVREHPAGEHHESHQLSHHERHPAMHHHAKYIWTKER